MSEQQQPIVQEAPVREAGKVNYGDFINTGAGEVVPEVKTVEQPAEEKEEPLIKEEAKVDQPPADKPAEEKPPVVKTPEEQATDLKTEAKELGLLETASKEEVEAAKVAKAEADKPLIEFTVEDIKGSGVGKAEEGTWKHVLEAKGYEVPTDYSEEKGFEAYDQAKDKYWESKIADVKSTTLDTIYSTLKPEVATAFKLMEMGVPEQDAFTPTRHVDETLKLEDAALVRLKLESQQYPAEIIDNKMEGFAAEPTKLKLEADAIRIDQNRYKQQILEHRDTLVQQYEQNRQNAILAQKEQETTHFKTALNSVSKFMDIPVSTEVKEAVFRKYANGAYENDLNSAQAKAELILYRELGQKIIKHLQSTAFAKGKDEIKKNLSNVPPLQQTAGQRVIAPNEGKVNYDDFFNK